jgi:dTDP-4-dehydrorhamnose reductase
MVDSPKVLVVGAGGIIGQHMMEREPALKSPPIYTRRTLDNPLFDSLDITADEWVVNKQLDEWDPDVIINLAGENRVDVVEADPDAHYKVNVRGPLGLAWWCKRRGKKMIQVSTQGIFSGENAPYKPFDPSHPLTAYGKQKAELETSIWGFNQPQCEEDIGKRFITIARLTFVLGVRPLQEIGRRNPLEDMIEKPKQLQVDDRFFSPVFAHDAARVLWEEALHPRDEGIFHIGIPRRVSRYMVAADLKYNLHGAINPDIQPISHEYFAGIAERPKDTTWAEGSRYYESYEDGLVTSYLQWKKLNK